MEYQIENIFIEKSCRKCAAKASPRPIYNFGKQPKTAIASRNYFKSKIIVFFLSNPVPFNRQNYQKQKGPGISDQSLLMLRNKFRKIPLLVMYYLTKFDDVI